MITYKEITCQLKFLEKIIKISFLTNFLKIFTRKILCNMKISNNINAFDT